MDKEKTIKEEEPSIQKIEPEVVIEKPELREFDLRLHNLEKLYNTIESLMGSAVATYTGYLEKKTESEKKFQEIEDNQHKRGTWIIAYSVTIIIVFCVICLIKEQYELVKLILTSGLAVGAGAGLTSVLSKKNKK